ncbi:MAG TPA: tail fiber domain-containing protein, partial [Candidatus Paceibacterota bacterium]|nr:tail fiber domain-containing protein [Candidatus Paceibacterota bacterium]
HAARNMDLETVNDATFWAGHDFTAVVDHDFIFHAKHDDTVTVDNNLGLAVGAGLSATVGNSFSLAVGNNLNIAAGHNFTIEPVAGVGLGTANPQSSLHVYSANNPTVVRVQSTGTPGFGRLEFVSNPQGDFNEWRPGYIQSTDSGNFTGGLAFFVNGTGGANKFGSNEVMRVVNGAVGINTTTPQTALDVNGEVKWGNGSRLSADWHGGLELGSPSLVGNTPFLDFHYGVGSGQDYNTRIINDGNECLSFYRASSATPMARFTASGLTVNGTFVSASDRNLKENFQPVDVLAVLNKVAALPVSRWNYKDDQSQQHLGPMAQDFYAAFGVGPDDKHIATVDEGGVALAAIQGLNQKLEQKETEIAELKARLERLEQLLTQTAK